MASLSVAAETQAQEQPIDQNREKASIILQQVAEMYAKADSIHLEAVEEQNHSSPLASDWQKVYFYLDRQRFSKFRIEVHTSWGSYVQVSDGTTEWIHSVNDDQYVERPLFRDGPSFMPSALGGLSYLRTAWTLPIWLEMLVANKKNGTLLPDETLQFSGEEIDCNVIKLGVRAHGDNMDRTIWVDKRHRTIRKIREHQTQEV